MNQNNDAFALENLSTLPAFDAINDQPNHTGNAKKEEGETMTNALKNDTTTTNLEILQDKAAQAAQALSTAYGTDSVAAIEEARAAAQFSVDAYNVAFLADLYAGFLKEESPILAAVKKGYFRKMKLNEKRTKTGVAVEVSFALTVINLEELDASTDCKITPQTRWADYVEKLAYVYAIRATSDIGGDVAAMRRKYDMSEFARSIKLDEGQRESNPASNKSLVKATQEAIDAILFMVEEGNEYNALRAVSHDVSYILYTAFKKGKNPISVSMPRTSTLVSILTEVMYRLVNGLTYSAEYKEIQNVAVSA